MIVAGVMSGTSADGIDVAMVRLENSAPVRHLRKWHYSTESHPARARLKLLGHASFPYSAKVRRTVLDSMNSQTANVADLARLNFLLGDLYAEAVLATQKKLRLKAELVGCHGQTIYHQGEPAQFLGRQLTVTWQLGEASRIAARLRVPVVSDFRPADMAVGGKGAPLVPYLDYLLYRDPRVGRIALNIGGIANLTAIPANAALDDVMAFDTGPGNMVIDAVTEQLFGKPYDHRGRIAARGQPIRNVIATVLRKSFFRQKPPKTAGREEFGREFARNFIESCRSSNQDTVATATALTADAIAESIQRHVLPRGDFSEVVASGGGTQNPTLMKYLAGRLRELGLQLRTSDEFGVPSAAKEAVAFAVLAFESWSRRPSNVPSATGARRAAVLGKISFP